MRLCNNCHHESHEGVCGVLNERGVFCYCGVPAGVPWGVPWNQRVRQLLAGTIDADDKAILDAAAMLAAGHGVKFVIMIRDGHYVDVRAERIEYDHRGRLVP